MNTPTRTPRLLLLSTLLFGAVFLLQSALAGFTPDRAGITHPTRSATPSLNNYTDALHYTFPFDERAFATVSKGDFTQRGDILNIDPAAAETILFHVYLNNTGDTDVTGVKVSTDSFSQNASGEYVTDPFSDSIDINNIIETDNATPSAITDTATVTSSNGNLLRLRFQDTSNRMWVFPLDIGGFNIVESDIHTDLFASGIDVGSRDAPFSGTFEGGDDQTGDDHRVEFQYRIIVEPADANLSIEKSASTLSVGIGEIITYTLDYANAGPIEATGVTIVDDYDQTLVSVNAGSLPAGCIDNGDTVTCAISGEVANGGSGSISYSVTADAIGTATNSATISSDMNDTDSSNDTDSVDLDITATPLANGDIVINELAWAGSAESSADEWIELHNTTSEAIDLSGFQLTSNTGSEALMLTIPTGTIPANGFFLISNYAETSSSSTLNVTPDLVDTAVSLSNAALQIKLYAGTWNTGATLLDTAGNGNTPLAGSNSLPRASMARKFAASDGTSAQSWFTHQLSSGFDAAASELGSPGNSSSLFSAAFPETVYEDGEDASDWVIYDTDPVGASVNSASGAIQTNGQWILNGYKSRGDWQNSGQSNIQWTMQFENAFARIYVSVDTNNGQRFLQYVSSSEPCDDSGNPQYIICGIGDFTDGGNAYTITRDLQADLTAGQPGTVLQDVTTFLVRGNGAIDNLKLLADTTGYHNISGNVTQGGQNLSKALVSFNNALPPVRSDDSGNYTQFGFTDATYEVSVDHLGTDFAQSSFSVLVDGADAVQNFSGTVASSTVYEDGSDASDWGVYDTSPAGATVTSVVDAEKGNVIETSGTWIFNGYSLDSFTDNNGQFVAKWDWKFENRYNRLYWLVETNVGQRYIEYSATNQSCQEVGADAVYIHCGLGDLIADGNWYTYVRDLEADLEAGQPGTEILSVLGFFIRGDNRLTNIELLSDTSGYYTLFGNVQRDGSDLPNVVVDFGGTVAPVRTDNNGDYQRFGFVDGVYTVSVEHDGTTFSPSLEVVNISGANAVQNFSGVTGSATVYEDGNDASDWDVYDNSPVGTISVLADSGPAGAGDNAIQLSGGAPAEDHSTALGNGTGFRFTTAWLNNGQLNALWDVNTTNDFVVYFELNTSAGRRYIEFNTFVADGSCSQNASGEYLVCGLPANSTDGTWNTLSKDLQAVVSSVQPDTEVFDVVRILLRGNLLIDNIRLQ